MKFFGKGTTTRLIEDPEEKRDKLVEFFRANIHNKYNIYYYGFIFCELLNFLCAVMALFITDSFLNNRFLGYGFQVHYYNKVISILKLISYFIRCLRTTEYRMKSSRCRTSSTQCATHFRGTI